MQFKKWPRAFDMLNNCKSCDENCAIKKQLDFKNNQSAKKVKNYSVLCIKIINTLVLAFSGRREGGRGIKLKLM